MTTRKELSKKLVEIISDYPEQLTSIIDELTFKLNKIQLDELEDTITNNYEMEA